MRYFPHVIALLAALSCAAILDWGLGGMVWSFWLTSLVFGTPVITLALGKNLIRDLRVVEAEREWRAILDSLLKLCLVPAIFVVWHVVIGLFATSAFPMQKDADALDRLLVMSAVFKLYWPVLPIALISRWRELLTPELEIESATNGFKATYFVSGRSTAVLKDLGRIHCLILALLIIQMEMQGLPTALRVALPYLAAFCFFFPLEAFSNGGDAEPAADSAPVLPVEAHMRGMRYRPGVRKQRLSRYAEGKARGFAFMVEYADLTNPSESGIVFACYRDRADADAMIRRLVATSRSNLMFGVYDLALPLEDQGGGVGAEQWFAANGVEVCLPRSEAKEFPLAQ